MYSGTHVIFENENVRLGKAGLNILDFLIMLALIILEWVCVNEGCSRNGGSLMKRKGSKMHRNLCIHAQFFVQSASTLQLLLNQGKTQGVEANDCTPFLEGLKIPAHLPGKGLFNPFPNRRNMTLKGIYFFLFLRKS